MTMQLSPLPKFFALNNVGLPLTGGLLYTYIAGSSTPKATYSDSTGNTANSNPVVLDSSGRADVWVDTGSYKFVLKDSLGNTIWTVDDIGKTILPFSVVNTFSDLRDLDVGSFSLAIVLGFSSIGDGGGGNFVWEASKADADDNGVIICPSGYTGQGRWVRVLDGYVTPKMYGAVGDGSNDDTTAIQAADTYAQTAQLHILLTDGTYFITSPTINSKIEFSTQAILSWQSNMNPALDVSISDQFQHFEFAASDPSYAPVLSGVIDVYPEWFGANGNGSFQNNTIPSYGDDTYAIQGAVNSCSVGMRVVFNSSKKYWSNSLTWKEGVGLCGSQPREADTTLTQANEYQANLQYSGSSGGDFISLSNSGTGGLRGFTIRDLIIDGNGLADKLINVETYNVLIENCTLRNATQGSAAGKCLSLSGAGQGNQIINTVIYNSYYGIYADASQTSGIISNCVILSNAECIYLLNGSGWVVDKNTTSTCSGKQIHVAGANYKIINNRIDDFTQYGIYIENTATGNSVIKGNNITALTHTGGTGIYITSTVANYVHCNNNTLIQYTTNSISCTGIATVNGGAVIPGNIFDNQIVGFTTPYNIADGYSTAYRYQDAQGLKRYKDFVGNESKLSSTSQIWDGQSAIINDTDIGASITSTSNAGALIQSVGGIAASTNIWNRKYLSRYSTSASWQGSRLHDGLGLDASGVTPRIDTRAWYERDPYDGSHHWGDLGNEAMTLDGLGLTVSLGGIPLVLAPSFQFGCVTHPGDYTTPQSLFLTIQKLLGQVYVTIPYINGGTSTSYTMAIDYYHELPQDLSSTNAFTTGLAYFNVTPYQQQINYIIGQEIKIIPYASQLKWMTGTVTSYDITTGDLIVTVETVSDGSGGFYSNWLLYLTSFPFKVYDSYTRPIKLPCVVNNRPSTQDTPYSVGTAGMVELNSTMMIFALIQKDDHTGLLNYTNDKFSNSGTDKYVPNQTIIFTPF